MIYSEGHKLRPYFAFITINCYDSHAHMVCSNCHEVCPEPGSECDDEPAELA